MRLDVLGHDVVGLARAKECEIKVVKEYHSTSILDKKAVLKATQDVDVVVHLAGVTSHNDIENNRYESLDVNLLASAKNRGAAIFTGATVLQLHKPKVSGYHNWHVDVVHTDKKLRERQGGSYRIHAKRVIVAAGSLGSTELLMRSQVSEKLQLSKFLGKGFSSNGDMLITGYHQNQVSNSISNEQIPFSKRHIGPTISSIIDTRKTSGRGGFVIEEMAVPAPLQRFYEELFTTTNTLHELSSTAWGMHKHGHDFDDPFALNHQAMLNTSLYAVMGDDDADGKLELSGSGFKKSDPGVPHEGLIKVSWPKLKYKQLFSQQTTQLEKMSKKSRVGGRVIPFPAWKLLPEKMMFLANHQHGPVTTVHPLGGCAMSDSWYASH